MEPVELENYKANAIEYFQSMQTRLLNAFAQLDPSASVEKKKWDRPNGGGGQMAVVRGPKVEKAGANFSEVYGDKYPSIEEDLKDKPFFATGVSTICHMENPYAPIGHMNLRFLSVGNRCWFGGGADLTPMKPFQEDTELFHKTLKDACDTYKPVAYSKFQKECENYFFIKHRNQERGVGGIFFDYLEEDLESVFDFIKKVGTAYIDAFFSIQKKRMDMEYTQDEKVAQEYWRSRYVEFNLLYDRGTRFGLLTGGNLEAIFVSMPPKVRW